MTGSDQQRIHSIARRSEQVVSPEPPRMDIYWRPHHEVYPELSPDQDFVAFDGEHSIGSVCLGHHSGREGQWRWSMFAHSTTGRVPFQIHGHEDNRGDAGRRVVEGLQAPPGAQRRSVPTCGLG